MTLFILCLHFLIFLVQKKPVAAELDQCLPGGCTNFVTGMCWGDSGSSACYDCFAGPGCSSYLGDDCLVDSMNNNPRLMQAYWQEHGGEPTTVIRNDWASGYQTRGIMPQLRDVILQLHQMMQNAEIEGYSVVPGYGAANVLTAAFYALTKRAEREGRSYHFFSQRPHYQVLPTFVEWGNVNTRFPSVWNTTLSDSVQPTTEGVVEVITAPNNPDSEWRLPILNDSSRVICDLVLNWPYIGEAVRKYNCDIMVFSMSKIGHVAMRFGWGLVKDPSVYNTMLNYLQGPTFGVSYDAQLKAYTVLKHHLDSQGEAFAWAREKLTERHRVLEDIFENCHITTIEGAEAQVVIDSFTRNVRGPNLYLQVISSTGELLDAQDIFTRQAGVRGRTGELYHGTRDFARFNALDHPTIWDQVEERFARFCSTKGNLGKVWKVPRNKELIPGY